VLVTIAALWLLSGLLAADKSPAVGATEGPSCAPARAAGPTTAFDAALGRAVQAGFRTAGHPVPTASVPDQSGFAPLFEKKKLVAPTVIWSLGVAREDVLPEPEGGTREGRVSLQE